MKLLALIAVIFLSACSTTPKIPLTPMQKFCKDTWNRADSYVGFCIGSSSAAWQQSCEYGRAVKLEDQRYYMNLWIENDCANHPDPNR